jgi:nicotinamide-nucleotide amidase
MLDQLIQIFRQRKLTLSFAESCSGGKLSVLLTEQAGISDIFLGSVVSYSNDTKVNLLGVRRDTLLSEGAVSEKIARQMAQGVRRQIHSDCSVAITGIAGPSGGSPEKPVGTVWFAASGPNFEVAEKKLFKGSRVEIQNQAAEFAIEFLLQSVLKS